MKQLLDSETGFFKQKHIAFRQSLKLKEVSQFSALATDEERFKFINKHPFIESNLEVQVSASDKNEDAAKSLKDDGNKAFQSEDYNAALYYYTRSYLKHPSTQNAELAILRANRSAALYHMAEYKLAIQEIDAAIALGYPKDLMYKIKDRKARCLLAMKQHSLALTAFRETLTVLDDAKLKSDRRQKWQRDVQIMIAMMSKTPAKDEPIEETKTNSASLAQANPMYPALSSSIEIKQTEQAGRFAQTNKKIEAGDVLAVEPAYCAVLLQEYSHSNCFQCMRKLVVSDACPTCARIAFCSSRCKDEAMKTHHGTECKILDTLWLSGASVTCLMALRIISQKPAQFFLDYLVQKPKNDPSRKYLSQDYDRVFNLVSHSKRRNTEDFLHRTHMAVFLCKCLKVAGYFLDIPASEREDAYNKIGSLILHHLQVLQFNAHEVSELQMEDKSLEKCKSMFIGGAVYPSLALFNHSCNPSIVRYFDGTKVVARAIHPHRAGEEVCENYGPIFTQRGRRERQDTLRDQYWFQCSCEACSQDWPTLELMSSTVLRFRCETQGCRQVIEVPVDTLQFMAQCTECGQHTNILKGLKLLQDTETTFRLARYLMQEGEPENALKKFLELLTLLDDTLAPPFRDYHFCQQAIRTCYLAQGNSCIKPKVK